MKTAILLLPALALMFPADAQQSALLNQGDAAKLFTRMVQLMESTTATAPGLARAAAPVVENARQSLENLRGAANRQDAPLLDEFLTNARAYMALAGAMPKPFPFPEEGRRQFVELREALDRSESHFRALLELKERQLRDPDRDNLKRYAEANSRLSPPAPGNPRVVFLGDSITDGWRLNEYFGERDYVNRGISGQITGQMLGRMMEDVIRHKPAAVLVLAGTNDIGRGVALEAIQNNLRMIAELAVANKIKPVLASVLPIHDYHKEQDPSYERSKYRPMRSILALNAWIQSYCQQHGFVYLDYFTAMRDKAGFLRADLADDGLHPNAAGYRVMAPLAQAAIDKAAPAGPQPQQKKRRFPF